MPRRNHGPTNINLKNLLPDLKENAEQLGVPLHYLCKKILKEHVRNTHPEIIFEDQKKAKEDTNIRIRLDELKAPLREDASEMEKPLRWLVFKVLKNYVDNLKK